MKNRTPEEFAANFDRFLVDAWSISEVCWAHVGSQRASKIDEKSGQSLERPLEESGVGFWRPLGAFGGPGGSKS